MSLYSKLSLIFRTLYWRWRNSEFHDAGVGGVWRSYRYIKSSIRIVDNSHIEEYDMNAYNITYDLKPRAYMRYRVFANVALF